MAEAIAALRERALERGIPVVYVNDNFGRWQSDFRALVRRCLEEGVRGEPVVRLLEPADDDYHVLKPMHSGFYQSSLDVLLEHLGVQTVILTGMAVDYCVLFTANDAYMRRYGVCVPRDCVAAEDPAVRDRVVALMERVLKADVTESAELDLDRLAREGPPGARPPEG